MQPKKNMRCAHTHNGKTVKRKPVEKNAFRLKNNFNKRPYPCDLNSHSQFSFDLRAQSFDSQPALPVWQPMIKYYRRKFYNSLMHRDKIIGPIALKDKIISHATLFCELHAKIIQELGYVAGFGSDPTHYFNNQPPITKYLKAYDAHGKFSYFYNEFCEGGDAYCEGGDADRYGTFAHFYFYSLPSYGSIEHFVLSPFYILDMPIWELIRNIESNPAIINFIIKHASLLTQFHLLLRDMIKAIGAPALLNNFQDSCTFILRYGMLASEFDLEFCLCLFKNEIFASNILGVCYDIIYSYSANNAHSASNAHGAHNAHNAHSKKLIIDKFFNLIFEYNNKRTTTLILNFTFRMGCAELIDFLLEEKFLVHYSLLNAFNIVMRSCDRKHKHIKKFILLGLWCEAFENNIGGVIHCEENGENFLDIIFRYSPYRNNVHCMLALLTNFVQKCSPETILKYFNEIYFDYISVDRTYTAMLGHNYVDLSLLDYLFEHKLGATIHNLSMIEEFRLNKSIVKKFMDFGFDIGSLEVASDSDEIQKFVEEILSEEFMVAKSARKY